MSAGSRHRHISDAHLTLLHRFLSDPHVLAALDQPHHVNSEHDCPDLCGYSMDGRTLYVDRHLAIEQPDIAGAPYEHWITALVGPRGHEPIEKTAMDVWGYRYPAAHEDLATPSEHMVLHTLGIDPKKYERQLRPYIKRAELERIEDPPEDLDCRPYYEDPDANDLRVLKHLASLGVADALHPKQFHPVKLGAKKAPDGHHYLPDHSRPGKYLRVLTPKVKMNGGRRSGVNSSAG